MTPTSTPHTRSHVAEWICPECGSGLANCQGLLTCTGCEWIQRP